MMSQLLFFIDLFGFQANLNFDGREKSKSKFGGLCSLLLFGFVGWAIYSSSGDLFKKVNPKTIAAQTNNENPGGVIMSPEGFPVGLQVQTSADNGFTTYVNESIFHINAYYLQRTRVTNESGVIDIWDTKSVALEKCKPEHFGKDLNEIYSKMLVLPWQCIAINQSEIDQIRLDGVFNSEIYRGFLMELAPCNNETSGGICASPEEIEKQLSGGWLDVNYNNMVVDLNNYENPKGAFQDYYYAMLSLSNYYETYIELGRVQVTTDSGWLLENLEVKNYTNVGKISSSMLGKPHPRGILATVYINMGKLENIYFRRYKKVQDVLAEIAGLTNTGLLVLFILTAPYFKIKFQEALMNELFDIKINGKKSIKKITESNKDQVTTGYREYSNIPQNSSKNTKNIKGKRRIKRSRSFNLRSASRVNKFDDFEAIRKSNSLICSKVCDYFDNLPEMTNGHMQSKQGMNSPKKTPRNKSLGLGIHVSDNKMVGILNKKTPQKSGSCLKLPCIKDPNIADFKPSGREKPAQPHPKYLKGDGHEDELSSQSSQNYILDVDKIESANRRFYSTIQKTPKSGNKRTKDSYKLKNEPNSAKESTNSHISKDSVDKTNNKLSNASNKKFEIALWEFFGSFICRTNHLKRKMKIINDGAREVEKRLDVRYILKEVRELEKLRALLLDPDQLILFENLPKAQITGEEDDEDEHTSGDLSFKDVLLRKTGITSEKSPEQVAEAYTRLKQKSSKTKLDYKLLEVFDQINL